MKYRKQNRYTDIYLRLLQIYTVSKRYNLVKSNMDRSSTFLQRHWRVALLKVVPKGFQYSAELVRISDT